MKMGLKTKKEYSKELRRKLNILIVLFIIFIINLIYVSFWKDGKQVSDDLDTQMNTESEKTDEEIATTLKNMEVFVTPLLDENSVLVAECWKDFCNKNSLANDSQDAELFYVTIPEENKDELWFFAKVNSENQIIKFVYERETCDVSAQFCEYTEEEVVNEVWQGNAPAIRDVQ